MASVLIGMAVALPSLPNSHPWYLQTSCLSSEMNPRDSGAMRCGHESSTTAHAPPSPFHATMDLPSTFIGFGAVSSRKSIGDIGYHARAQSNRSPAAGASAGARSVVLDGGSEMDCARTAPPRADRRIARRGEGGASVSRWPVANAARPARIAVGPRVVRLGPADLRATTAVTGAVAMEAIISLRVG